MLQPGTIIQRVDELNLQMEQETTIIWKVSKHKENFLLFVCGKSRNHELTHKFILLFLLKAELITISNRNEKRKEKFNSKWKVKFSIFNKTSTLFCLLSNLNEMRGWGKKKDLRIITTATAATLLVSLTPHVHFQLHLNFFFIFLFFYISLFLHYVWRKKKKIIFIISRENKPTASLCVYLNYSRVFVQFASDYNKCLNWFFFCYFCLALFRFCLIWLFYWVL